MALSPAARARQSLLRLAVKAQFRSIESTKAIGYPRLLSTDCLTIRRRWNQWSRSSAFHSAAIGPSAHLPTRRSHTSTNAAWPNRSDLFMSYCDEFKESEAAMNHSLYSAD